MQDVDNLVSSRLKVLEDEGRRKEVDRMQALRLLEKTAVLFARKLVVKYVGMEYLNFFCDDIVSSSSAYLQWDREFSGMFIFDGYAPIHMRFSQTEIGKIDDENPLVLLSLQNGRLRPIHYENQEKFYVPHGVDVVFDEVLDKYVCEYLYERKYPHCWHVGIVDALVAAKKLHEEKAEKQKEADIKNSVVQSIEQRKEEASPVDMALAFFDDRVASLRREFVAFLDGDRVGSE